MSRVRNGYTALMRLSMPLVVSLALLTGCPKKNEEPAARPAEVKPAAPAVKTAEVEFFGAVHLGKVTAARTVFVAMKEPCVPVLAQAHIYGQTQVDSDKLFAEYFAPQGSVAHLCAFGFNDQGEVVAAATYAKNPVTFQGEGEVIFGNVDLTLEPLAAPAPAPKFIP